MNRPRPARRVRRGAAALVATGLALLLPALAGAALLAPTAAAHGGDGRLELVELSPPQGDEVTVTVRLTYAGDGHSPDEATVTVAGDGAGGAVTPAVLQPGPEPGLWTGTVATPGAGSYDLRVTAVSPPATLALPTVVVPAVAGPGATPAAGDGGPSDTVVTQADPGDVPDPLPDPLDAPTDGAATGSADDGDGGPGPWVWALVAVAVVAAVGSGVWALTRRAV